MTLAERGFEPLAAADAGGAAVLCGDRGPGLEVIVSYAVLSARISLLLLQPA